jgi:hypothetical protein
METNQSINQPSSEEPEIEMVFFLALVEETGGPGENHRPVARH